MAEATAMEGRRIACVNWCLLDSSTYYGCCLWHRNGKGSLCVSEWGEMISCLKCKYSLAYSTESRFLWQMFRILRYDKTAQRELLGFAQFNPFLIWIMIFSSIYLVDYSLSPLFISTQLMTSSVSWEDPSNSKGVMKPSLFMSIDENQDVDALAKLSLLKCI